MAIPKKNLGAQLTEKLNQQFNEQYNMAIARGAYDPNTESYKISTGGERITRDGIESWHAKGTEHYLAQQLEVRIQKMETAHKREMLNLANQVLSMNNAIEARVMHINGFYTWLIETYPETVAQSKALLDLKRLTEGEE